MEIDTILQLVPVVLYALSHIAALFGKPQFVKDIKVASAVVDVLSANYGKATNKVNKDTK